MSQLTLTTEDQFKFMPPCYVSLHCFTGTLYHQQHNLTHPAIMLSKSWGKFIASVQKFLDVYDAKSANPSGGDLHDIEQEYENVLYQGTELTENMLDNLKKCLLPKEKWDSWKPNSLKSWRDHPKAICNKIKHNNNFLVTLEGVYQLGIVRGYSLCHHVNEAIKPNTDFHSKQAAFPYGNDLRRIMAHLYLIGDAINHEVGKILTNQSKVSQPLAYIPNSNDILLRITKFMPLPFHYQKARDIVKFKFDGRTLEISDSGGQYISPGQGLIKSYFSGDGHTRTFHVF